MFTIDLQMVNLAIGLVGLILINILLGSINAILEKKFDKVKFKNGIIKGVIVAPCFVGVYFIGLLTPTIIIMEMNGQEVTLITAIQIILVTSFLYYAKEVIIKFTSFVNAKYDIKEKTGTTIVNNYNTVAPEDVRLVKETFTAVRAGDRGEEPPSTKV